MKSLKKTLLLLVVFSMILSTLVPAFAATDVSGLDCEDQVTRMEALGVIEGFEDGLIGKKVGDKVDLDLIFPEDYGAESLAGQDVIFTVTINSATRTITPEYNIDFVKNNTKFDSIEEYEEGVEKTLYEEKEAEGISNQQKDLWSQALENTNVLKYPEEIVDYYMEFNSKQMDEIAKSYGISREELMSEYDFGDEEEFEAMNEYGSKLAIKQEMLIEYISAKEDLNYTKQEEEAFVSELEASGYDDTTIEAQSGKSIDDYVRIELLYQKVLEFLLDNAAIKQFDQVSTTTNKYPNINKIYIANNCKV